MDPISNAFAAALERGDLALARTHLSPECSYLRADLEARGAEQVLAQLRGVSGHRLSFEVRDSRIVRIRFVYPASSPEEVDDRWDDGGAHQESDNS